MKPSMHPLALHLLLILAVVLGAGAAHADPPEAPRAVYRIEVSVAGLDDNAHGPPATYAVDLLENQPGSVATGANIPLTTASGSAGSTTSRQDIGLNLHFSYSLRGGVVLLSGNIEMSTGEAPAAGGAVTIHRVRIDGVAPITPGTPASFGSVYDINSHRRYEVTVAARRLL